MSIQNLSIKKQLTFWYAIIIFINTAVLFASFYFLTVRYFLYETDRSLAIHTSQIVYSINDLEPKSIHDEQVKRIVESNMTEMPGIFVEVMDQSGMNAQGAESEFKDIGMSAITNDTQIYTQHSVGDTTMRVIAYPITTDSEPLGVVIMGHQIDVYESTLDQLRNIGVTILIFLTLPALLVGYLLANSATKPISKLSEDIDRITTEDLSRKLDVQPGSAETKNLIENFNSLLDRLHKAFTLERQFLGEMAHEIKTPLTVIKSNTQVTLAKERSTQDYKASLEQTLKQVDKLSERMHSLMDFAWSQNTDIEKTFSVLDLTQLVKEIAEVTAFMAAPKNIQVTSQIKEDIQVKGKEEKLYQALYNLADNAVKFTPPSGKVSIELERNDQEAKIKVTDTGIGIEENKLSSIFNRFYRTEDNKNIAGHGLGLAITESIIKAHKGTIEVTSKKGAGTHFIIYLPVIK
jgi:two-component system heavy metal sensor histidine kinase CusS